MSSIHNNTIITDTIHISALLGRLLNNHCAIEIKSIDSSGRTQSLGISEILNINSDENNLLFDALTNNPVSINQTIKVFTKHNGIDIHFNACVSNIIERNQSTYFYTNIPQEVVHKQRRQQYRAVLQNLWKIPVTLIDKSINKSLSAYVYNISTGGINVRSSTENFHTIKQNSIIDTLIQLPDNHKVQCKLQVRQILSNKTGGFQQLAGQFINLDTKQEKYIQAFVNKVERKNITTQSQLHATE